MRKFLLFTLLFPASICVAQYSGGPSSKGGHHSFGFFAQNDRKHAKYFIALSYGIGKAWWHSTLGNAEIYDQNGGIIKSGNIKFQTTNATNTVGIEGSVPIGKLRMGLGINFDYFFLDKLELIDPAGNQFVLYSETFRFDKFFISCELPFNFETERIWSVSAKLHAGYFGFSYVDHFSLFGEEALAKTYFGALGPLLDIKLYPHSYVFLFPFFEYKYYDNSRFENPVQVHHNIFDLNLTFGIRIDVSKEK